jgi:signal peptidase II
MATGARRRAVVWTFGGAALIVVCDQAAKAWIVATLGSGQPPIVLIPGVLELIFRLNTGMAFSLLVDFPQVLTVVAAVASIALSVVNLRMTSAALLPRLALALLLGGAVGNLIDRLRLGAVIDFVYVRLINFPAFNVADSALTIGVLLAAWVMSRGGEPGRAPAAGDEGPAGASDRA